MAFSRKIVAGLSTLASLGMIGCQEETEFVPTEQIVVERGSDRIARVHLTSLDTEDELEGEPRLQIEARFVEFRGLDESFVRERTGLPVYPFVGASIDACEVIKDEWSSGPLIGGMAEDGLKGSPEMLLLDGGDLAVQIGTTPIDVPLALVPDLLDYVSGVEYFYADDRSDFVRGPDGRLPVSVMVQGAPEEGLPPFRESVAIPPSPVMEVSVQARGYNLIWDEPGVSTIGEEGSLVIELRTYRAGEYAGSGIRCRVSDDGSFSLAHSSFGDSSVNLSMLDTTKADTLRLTSRRFATSFRDVGLFDATEVIVESRSHQLIRLSRLPY